MCGCLMVLAEPPQEESVEWPTGTTEGGRRGGATQPAVAWEIKRWVKQQHPSEKTQFVFVRCVFNVILKLGGGTAEAQRNNLKVRLS